MRRLFALLVLVLAAAAGPLRADIWECQDSGGGKRFTNVKSEAAGCRQLEVTPNVMSAPSGAKPAPGRSGEFPKVSPQVQQQRDDDRKKILEAELATEEKLLQDAQRTLAEQQNIRLGSERNAQRMLDRLEPYQKDVRAHEDNIANLRKELDALR